MDKRKTALDILDEVIESLETLDISFLTGEDKSEAEYAINEAILDIQQVEGMIDNT
jgi:NAD kinase|tara:strand:+ start:371 stop:538 length:168 start_codon:yes stop_codon:yes gene_type:complete